ncbi:MAG: DnaA regulatory inactivator Hda [Pseudomonadales bacterium]
MKSSPMQLPLEIQLRPDNNFHSFYVAAANRELVTSLKSCSAGGVRQLIYLHGEAQSGRSHLLEAACREVAAGRAVYMPLAELHDAGQADALENLEQLQIVCLDDIQHIAGQLEWEHALFHLFNRVLASPDTNLLVASSASPPNTGFHLPDLLSRLNSMLVYRVQSMDDTEKAACLQFRARQLGLELGDEACSYILLRADRQLGNLLAVLSRLDSASLAAQRRLTVPFVKQVMGW